MIHTAEAVSPNHPDKICDRVSDAILDACLRDDPMSRVAVETMGGHGIVTITGELTTNAFVDIPAIVRRICGQTVGAQVNLSRQSNEIARGVDTGGAGDQGIMVGYACDETPSMLPLEMHMARNLNQTLFKLHPRDGKTQVTVIDGVVDTVLASFSGLTRGRLDMECRKWFEPRNLIVNPAGDWDISGFDADTGLTGRKIVNDAYGPRVPVGGGAYSGKDPTKVDRSAAYMARRVAKDYIRKGAKEALVRIAYAIGMELPLMAVATVDGKEYDIDGYDLRPKAIIDLLDLRKPIYEKTAEWGAYGNNEFPWEK